MKICGIIVEYNPFHNGHLHHLNKTRELTKADIVIAVMSGNFVQRGEPAIIGKEARVKEALRQGIDLVVELPFLYTVENANIFAYYALSILNHLGVNQICFGSETGDTKEFLERYENSSLLSPHLDFRVSDLMDEGYAYPKAMAIALEEIDDFKLETPNDILGLAYYSEIKKKNYPIEIFTIKRSNDYKSLDLDSNIVSATAIRGALQKDKDVSEFTSMSEALNKDQLVFLDDFFDTLKYKLISSEASEIRTIHLVNEGIENLFKKNIVTSNNMQEFINSCISKRYTAARIKRTIIHILCNTKKELADEFLNKDISYIRLLGFNKKGSDYLRSIRKDVSIPILSKFRGNSFKLLSEEKKVTYIYASNLSNSIRNRLYDEEHYLYPIRFVN